METNREAGKRKTASGNQPVEWVVGKFLPTGTVTFLFTDIVGSTPNWESQPDLMEAALQIHNDILFAAIQQHGGQVFKIVGDEFQAAFPTAPQALKAAVAIQLGLQAAAWNDLGPLKVRMGLHTGEAHLDDIGDEYAVSHTKNRVGRIRSAAHGGQILLSKETADLCETVLPAGLHLQYLGEFRMKGLARREPIFQATAAGLPAQFPPLATLADPHHNLPRQLTPFIGREKEIAQVRALLAKNPLVTLTGSGGVGKTRLSLQVAEEVVDDLTDGVCYVELASLTDPQLVVQTVAQALGLREVAGLFLLDAVKYYLQSRQVLLVLDNCEHLIAACAHLADSLLRSCPQVKLLASSREALGVAGEVAFHVPSLSLPGSEETRTLDELSLYDGVRLFVERGQTVLPAFQLTSENAPHVVRICQRLDGIPLALELAAARLHVLSTEQLASRLDNMFRLLVGGSRTAVPRQQTLRATIDWSYQLLSELEQRLLRRLSVFVGGFSLESVEMVCAGDDLQEGEVLDLLASLVNKSMVITDRLLGLKTRYHLLETVRQYGREKLFDAGESKALHDRHLAYYVDFTERAEPHLHGANRLEWTAYLRTEYTNLREALDWAFSEFQTTMDGLRIATAITDRFWFVLNLREGEHWLKRGLQTAGESIPPRLLARVYYCLGRMLTLNDRPQCQHYFDLCIARCRQIGPEANRELALALSLSAGGLDLTAALARTEEAVQVARTIASTDVWPLAESLFFRSDILLLCGLQDQAIVAAQESLRLAEKGDRWMTGGLWVSGVIQTLQGQFELARHNLEKSLDLNLEVDDRFGVWYSLIYLGWLCLRTGMLQQAHAYCHELFKLYERLKMPLHFYELALMGLVLARSQDTATSPTPEWLDAARLLAASAKLQESYVSLSYEYVREDYLAGLALLQQKLGPAVFEAAWSEGLALAESLDGAIAYALALTSKYTFQDQAA